jgi:hypothetical protein
MPPIDDTFCIVDSKAEFWADKETSCISDIPDVSIEPTAFWHLMSNSNILRSVPTEIANDPSCAIFIELISPVWPLRLATCYPVSEFHTFTSLSVYPPDSSTRSSVGLKHTVRTMA